jgi:hypothetical protein
MYLYLLPEITDTMYFNKVATEVVEVKMKTIVKQFANFKDPLPNITNKYFIGDKPYVERRLSQAGSHREDTASWCFRYQLDQRAMISSNISVNDIVSAFERSPLGAKIFMVHSDTVDITDPFIRIYLLTSRLPKDESDDVSYISAIENEIGNTIVKGIPGVLKATVAKRTFTTYDENGAPIRTTRNHIVTTGGSFSYALRREDIDITMSSCTDITETQALFGTQATRAHIYAEIEQNLPGLAKPLYQLLATCMTSTADITAVDRFGNKKRNPNNILYHIGNGDPIRRITSAATTATYSRIEGFTASMIMGMMPSVGSAYCTMFIDEEFIKSQTAGDIDDLQLD